MRTKYLLFIIFSFCISSICSAQNEIQQWRFGAGLGINSMRLAKGDKNFLSGGERELEYEGDRSSFQGHIASSYRLSKNFRLVGNLGVTHTKCHAYRKTVDGPFLFGDEETKFDTVIQKYLLIDFPLFLRWQIVSLENKELQGVKPFLDFGFSFKIPLINKSEYRQNHITDPFLGDPFSQYNSGNLKIKSPALYFAIGFFAGEHFTLSYSWTGLRSEADKGINIKYHSTIKSLTLCYFY